MSRWRAQWRHPRRLLTCGAVAAGFETEQWTLQRIARVRAPDCLPGREQSARPGHTLRTRLNRTWAPVGTPPVLRYFRRQLGRPLIVIWDGLNAHRSAAVARFLAAHDPAMVSSYQNEVLHRWSLVVAHATDVVGGVVPQVPYARESSEQRFAPIDSARQLAALRFVLDHTFRGKDELVQSQFYGPGGPAPDPVALLLLDSLPAGWTIDRWREKQSMILDRLISPYRLPRLRDAEMHPAVCAELAALNGQMKLAAERAKTPSTQQFVARLRAQIDRVTTGAAAVCP